MAKSDRTFSVTDFWEYLKEVVSKNPKGRPFDKDGNFIPDPTPVAPPIGYVQEPSMFDRVRDMVRREMSNHAQAEGFESFEEADDFYIDDDVEPFSPYEEIIEQARPDGPVIRGETNTTQANPPAASSGAPGRSPEGVGLDNPANPSQAPAQAPATPSAPPAP